jgi:hypothetical protein
MSCRKRLSALTRCFSPCSSVSHSGGNDARHDVERDQALGSRILAIDSKRDAQAMEGALRLFALARDLVGGRAVQPV